ncbi:MAG: hypothetical protein JNL83_21020 [Myxococcales bacterium]|nr:hypothetical protein [Myxococcales bacterium]
MFEDDLTEIETAFFAEGARLERPAESFADLDAEHVRRPFWRRLFARPDHE